MLWLELYGCLTARNMLIAWTGSYFVALAIWALERTALTGTLEAILCVLPIISVFLLFKAYISLPATDHPVKMSHAPSIPWKLVIVLATFAFAFGISDVVTGQNMFTWVSKVGMGISELIVLLCVLFFYKNFSFKFLVALASSFIAAGLIGAFFLEDQAVPSFILANASSEIYLILVYAIACIVARQLRTSAAYLGGLFAGIYKVFLQLGKSSALFAVDQLGYSDTTISILAIVMVIITIVATLLLIQDGDIVEKRSWEEHRIDPNNAVCVDITEEYKLTPKEASILLMLAKKQDTAQIAEELFLSQSTVRAHTSNIYKKLDIHSRKELDELIESRL